MSERKLVVVDYQPEWAEQFTQESQRLFAVLKGLEFNLQHIGSTSIPGLAAKPIIDMVMECDELEQLDERTEQFERAGYVAKGEFGIPGRRYFKKGGVQHTHHIHAFRRGDDHVKRHIAFRDYLRDNPDVRQAYGDIKREAIALANNDIQKYMAHKNDFIKHYEAIALVAYHA